MELLSGRIVRAVGGFYYVEAEGRVYECRARGKFRLLKLTPLVGDLCRIQPVGADEGYVSELLPRKNWLKRPAVANIDRLFIVCSKAPPETDPFLIDKLSVIAEHHRIRPVIVLNKCDIDPAEELFSAYTQAGFPVIRTSAKEGAGLDALREAARGGVCAFTGNSGVGKSSLLNRLCPGLSLDTACVSEKIGRGRHTTRQVTLFSLGEETYIADTPGFSSLELSAFSDIGKEDVRHAFPEFRPFEGECRFAGCAHIGEKGCAVLAAVARGAVSEKRHESYVKMYESLKNRREWEQPEKEETRS